MDFVPIDLSLPSQPSLFQLCSEVLELELIPSYWFGYF